MDKIRLMRIGNNVASLWDGSCIDAWTTPDGAEFLCVEHGEQFVTELNAKDFAEYDY